MDSDAIVQSLVDEARVSLADFGPFGLYEFVWTLNSTAHDLSAESARALSRRAAERLVSEGSYLYWIRWPSGDVVAGPLPASVLDEDDAWRNTEVYVALMSNGSHA